MTSLPLMSTPISLTFIILRISFDFISLWKMGAHLVPTTSILGFLIDVGRTCWCGLKLTKFEFQVLQVWDWHLLRGIYSAMTNFNQQ